jgi:hypothetical protein
VEEHFHPDASVAAAQEPDAGDERAARRRRAALGWLLFLVVVAGLVLISWPRIAPLMHKSVAPTAPPSHAGTPGQAAAGAQAGPKRPPRDYPPCTATRTDSCIQQDSK